HRAAAGQASSLQWRPAFQTGLAAPPIDEQLLLVATTQAEAIDVADDRRASRRNAVLQDILNGPVERPPFTHGEPMSPPARTDSSTKTCLVGIDIADAGQK